MDILRFVSEKRPLYNLAVQPNTHKKDGKRFVSAQTVRPIFIEKIFEKAF